MLTLEDGSSVQATVANSVRCMVAEHEPSHIRDDHESGGHADRTVVLPAAARAAAKPAPPPASQ